MSTDYIVSILLGLISAVALWIGNLITNRPKKDETNVNKINTILSYYEKINDDWEKRYERAEARNQTLCDENDRLRKRIKELENNERR
jgi:predicted RNase H-like nuclease (RuvC/YqgF family)